MPEDKYCGMCRHHRYDDNFEEWYCDNNNSDNYTAHTGYMDGEECEDYEERDE